MENWLSSEFAASLYAFFAIPDDASFWNLINSPFLVAIIASIIGFRLNARLTKTRLELNEQIANTQADADTALRIVAQDEVGESTDEDSNFETVQAAVEDMVDGLAIRERSGIPTVAPSPDSGEQLDVSQDELFPGGPKFSVSGLTSESYDTIGNELSPDTSQGTPAGAAKPHSGSSSVDEYREMAQKTAEAAKERITAAMQSDTDGRHQRTYLKLSGSNPIARVIALQDRNQLSAKQATNLIALFKIWNKYSKGRAANRKVPKAVAEHMRSLLNDC